METGWDGFHGVNKSHSVRAADLLCLRKHDPSDLVAATKPYHFLLIPACIGMACCFLHVTYTGLLFIKWGPSRHSAGVVPYLIQLEVGYEKTCSATALAAAKE